MSTVPASPKLLNLIEQWADTYVSSSELVGKIIAQAEEEQLSKEGLRSLIVSALKNRGLSAGHIRKILPQGLKRDYVKPERKVQSHYNSRMMRDSEPESEPRALTIREKDEIQGRNDTEDEEPDAVAEWQASAEAEKTKDEKISALETQVKNLDAKTRELEDKLQPFTTAARCFVGETECIFKVEVDPRRQKAFLEVNREAMKRMVH